MRYSFFRRLMLVPLAVVLLVVITAATVPTETAQACLPCNCPKNPSLNCFGPYVVFTPTTSSGCSILVMAVDNNGKGRDVIRVGSKDLAALPAKPEKNTLIASKSIYALYKLTTGEYQVNVGPDAENKVHVARWAGCPAGNVTEETFVSK